MEFRGWVLALVCLAVMPPNGSATYIHLVPKMSPPTIITGGYAEVPFSVENRGDETAYGVKLVLLPPEGFSSEAVALGNLAPGQAEYAKFVLNVSDFVESGTFSIPLRVHYSDENQYPFSSVAAFSVVYNAAAVNDVLGLMGGSDLEQGFGLVNLTLRSVGDQAIVTRTELVLPDEFVADSPVVDVTVGPHEVRGVLFRVTSIGALPGSTYPILAVTSYSDGGRHYSIVSNAVLRFGREEGWNPFPYPRWVPLLGLAGLAVIAVLRTVEDAGGRRRIGRVRRFFKGVWA
jgi:hypothetical protein